MESAANVIREKDEAYYAAQLRQTCVQFAISMNPPTHDVLRVAREIEAFISGGGDKDGFFRK